MIYIIEQTGKPTILEINKTIYLVSFEHTFIYFKLSFTLLENTNKWNSWNPPSTKKYLHPHQTKNP